MAVLRTLLTLIPLVAFMNAATGSNDPVARAIATEATLVTALPDAALADFLSEAKRDLGSNMYEMSWLDAQPIPKADESLKCLSEALYFEARGESLRGQFAVAEVILNRVDSGGFPDTVCDVINQGSGRKFACQFTYTCDGKAETIGNPEAYARVSKVAKTMLDGAPRSLTNGATYYHTDAVSPSWSHKFAKTTTIGVHLFYRPHIKE